MKLVLKLFGVLVLVLVLIGAGVYTWASSTSSRMLAATYEPHSVDFPVPFPLDAAELDASEPDESEVDASGPAASELDAREVAIERGRHLVEARYACVDCHGEDFGGGVMVDAFPIGRLLGPNLTTGEGSRTVDYTPAQWDWVVRHGVLPDGTPSAMPSQDFAQMSDQELSDIVTYIRSLPPVDNEVPPVALGPLGKILLATGQMQLSADIIGDGDEPHQQIPPPAEVSVAFGRHLAAPCTGCHGQDLSGGPIAGGDPSWGPAADLTPGGALDGWTYEDFSTVMREGRRPDGTEVQEPMTFVAPMARSMTEVEMEALWTYLQSVSPAGGS